MEWRKNKKILLAVTGGIAAYKAPEIVRYFQKNGADVRVMLSQSAEAFVSPMVLATLTAHPVWRECDFLDVEKGASIPHIQAAQWADGVIVAPATAEHVALLAQGRGNSLIAATCLATRAPVLVCPAMNTMMYGHQAVQNNLQTLKKLGYFLLDPDEGMLACGEKGTGRLPDPQVIAGSFWPLVTEHRLKGRRVVITAGPTREFLDPVRFISNPSSGKMGAALAEVARDMGADVTLLWGPATIEPPCGVKVVPVISADDLLAAAQTYGPSADLFIAAAAVGDYKAQQISKQKIKREHDEIVERTFVRNPDIAAWQGQHKKQGALLVGFAAETEQVKEHAKGKLERKNLDYIVANDLTAPDAGFGVDTNRVTVLSKDQEWSCSGSKFDVAYQLLLRFAEKL